MKWEKFKETLELTHQFPTEYFFKFVLKKDQRHELVKLLCLSTFTEKDSAQGNYLSISFSVLANDSETIIDIYRKAATIKGIILL
jgi:uncharacterized protein